MLLFNNLSRADVKITWHSHDSPLASLLPSVKKCQVPIVAYKQVSDLHRAKMSTINESMPPLTVKKLPIADQRELPH